jgi:hypothetical protein
VKLSPITASTPVSGRVAPSRTRAIDGRLGAAVVFACALVSFGVQSLGWTITLGRDWQDYFVYWRELFRGDPLFQGLMLVRMPLPSLILGPAEQFGGAAGLELALALLFAVAVTAWVAAARFYGRRAAIAVAVVLGMFPAYGWFFHRIGSDPVFSAVLAVTTWWTFRAVRRPDLRHCVVLALLVVGLVMTRSAGQPFALLVLLPLGLPLSWRARALRIGAGAAVGVVLLGTWAVYNAVRFDDLTVARGASAGIPLYRAFVTDRIVDAENGPATREVVSMIEKTLLPMEPYRSFGFDADEVLQSRSTWAYDDTAWAADKTWGFDDDGRHLLAAGLEAVRAHPGAYAKGVALTLGGFLVLPYTNPRGPGATLDLGVDDTHITDAVIGPPGRGRRLPGDVEALGTVWSIALLNTWVHPPSPRFRLVGGVRPLDDAVWFPIERRTLVWKNPADQRRYAEVREEVRGLADELARPDRQAGFAQLLRAGSILVPAGAFWLLLGLVFAVRFRARGLWPLWLLVGGSVIVLLETALGFPPDQSYAMPFLPVFVLFGVAAIAGRRGAGHADLRA